MNKEYREYLAVEWNDFMADEIRQNIVIENTADQKVEKVLDIGCGAGQEMLPLVTQKGSFGVGMDISPDSGAVARQFYAERNLGEKVTFVQANGEILPFADASFEVVICRGALPYVDFRQAIPEIARVLQPKGKCFLKMHSPLFYYWMIKKRMPSFFDLTFKKQSPIEGIKQLAYPVICFACGTLNHLTGKHPRGGIWDGKEVYQTRKSMNRVLAMNNMKIVSETADTNIYAPAFLIVKQ